MNIEHTGLNVPAPLEMAKWYVANLGMKVVRSFDNSTHTHFLADSAGHTMIEIYCNRSAPIPDYPSMDPLVLHICFSADDVDAARRRLLAAGATPVGDIATTGSGDLLAMLRDPWGVPIQLAKRSIPMI
jgi:catechol 2,3-dioxygenase-like lactoylglutathione lyase family enzyme